MELSKKTTILFSPSVHERLSLIAREQGVSLGELVRRACETQYGILPEKDHLPAASRLGRRPPPLAEPLKTADSQALRAVDVVGAVMQHKVSQEIAARFRRRRNLRDHRFPDVVQELARARLDGELIVRRDDVFKMVLVREGKLVFAQSSDPDDRLGDMLLVSGRVTLDQYLDAQRGLHQGRRAGSVFVEIGAIQPAEIAELVVAQTKATICRLFTWAEGEYWLAETPEGDHETISLKSSAPDVIMDGIDRIDAWSQIEHGIGGADERYHRATDCASRIAQMTLSDEQRGLLDLLEHSQSVEGLCEASALPSIDVCRTLWAFKVIGVIEPGERDFAGLGLPGEPPSDAGFTEPGRGQARAATGSSGAAHREPKKTFSGDARTGEPLGQGKESLRAQDFPSVVSQVQHARTSGVLVVSRKDVVKRLVLRDGRIVFAQSSDPDDRLGEQLLIRRKITLRQYREAGLEVRKGRRLGAVLVEMGAIAADELIEVLVAQCRAIIYSLFEWTDGKYWFEEASATDREMITLKLSTADVIMEGIQRVDAWSRIEAGLGGIGTRYRQAEDCDARVARMTLSAERKRLLGLLSQAWDATSLCRVAELPSIDVCRTLWAFRVIGAIEEVD